MKPTSTNMNFLTFRCSVVLTCLILPAPVALSSIQEDDESAVLARIGALTITVQEYLERIDLTPWPGKDNPGTRDSAKVNALAALVAEKLLSLQAIEQGITTAEKTRLELKALERVLSRDELYKTEVIQKISVTPDEAAAGLDRYASVITLNSFIMRSGESALQLANYLNARNGALIVPTEGIISHDTITIRMGDLTESHEKEAYAIDSVNEARAFSASDGRWVVFQLLSVSTNVAHANASVAERTAHVLRILRNRKEGNRVSEYLHGIFSQKLEMNPALFHVFADTLRSIILLDSAAHREEGRYGIRDDDVDTAKVRLRAFLAKPFITSGKYSVPLEEVVDELKYFSIQFSSLQRNAFLQTLNQNLLRIAEAGIVSQEALDRRMNWHSSVQRELGMWGNAFQADKLLRHLADSIGNSLRKEGIVDDTEALAWQRMNRYLGRLAEKFGVEMDLAKVKQVNINPSNIITRRFIGFGGGMMGVPMILKLWDWLKEWEVSKPVPQ